MVWFLLSSARFPHPLPIGDWLAICLQFAIDYAGIVGNIIVLLAIICRSPASWRSYKILLIKQALVDLLALVSCDFVIERMIPTPIGTAMIYLGPCTVVSPFSCHVGHSVMINAQTYSILIVAASFVYRLHILKHNAPSSRWVILICTAMVVLPICVFILTLLTIDEEEEVRAAFRGYNLDEYVVQGHLTSHARLAHKVSALYNAGSALPVTISVFLLRRRVLTLQACLPVFHALAIVCYMIEKKGLHHSPANEHAIRVLASLMTAVSPYISIVNIRTFRDFALCRKKKRTMVNLSLTAVS